MNQRFVTLKTTQLRILKHFNFVVKNQQHIQEVCVCGLIISVCVSKATCIYKASGIPLSGGGAQKTPVVHNSQSDESAELLN